MGVETIQKLSRSLEPPLEIIPTPSCDPCLLILTGIGIAMLSTSIALVPPVEFVSPRS